MISRGTSAVLVLASLAFSPCVNAQLFPPEFELSSLQAVNGGDGTAGIVLNGIDVGDQLGGSVSAAGDVNGDGIGDLILGAPGVGESYVVFGTAAGFAPEFGLSSLLSVNGGDGSTGFVLIRMHNTADPGDLASAAGDVNGDGIGDLIIGAPRTDNGPQNDIGETYVVFGSDTGFAAEMALSSLLPANGGDGSAGFVLKGIDATDFSGNAVSAAGDVNSDGIGDLFIAARSADPDGRGQAGEVYVVFGTDSGFWAEFELSSLFSANGGDGSTGFVLKGIDPGDRAGFSLSAAGDVNSDGHGDLIIGTFEATPADRTKAGQSYVVFGTDAGFAAEIELSELLSANGGDGSAGFVINGIDNNDDAGEAVSGAGDVNGDGISDVIVGAKLAAPDGRVWAGESYVIFGTAAGFAAEIELSSLLAANGGDGSVGFVLKGIDGGDFSGTSVSGAGDMNGDGIGDVIVGAFSANPGGRDRAGESYVLFGTDGGFPAEVELSSLLPANGGDGSAGFVVNGIDAVDLSGLVVSAAGDVNSDGVGDVVVGAWFADPGGRDRAGEAYVIFGRNDTDADLVADLFDNCPAVANADQTDTDGDEVGDACDICIDVANTDQRDTDGDGFGNLCDADLTNDCLINFDDLSVMKMVFFGPDPDADLDGSGSVNFADLNIMKDRFFGAPGPSGVPNACD